MKGSLHSFDLSTGVDGPGTRFVAFLAGCPLRCLYCHSPDTWYRRSGTATTVDELIREIRRYERFLKVTGGGVTLSGGEPLQQPAFVREVFERCHQMRLHTALDTSGFLGDRADDALLDATDLVLLDVKSGDPETYRRVTRTGRLSPTVASRTGSRTAASRSGYGSCSCPDSPTRRTTSTPWPGSSPRWTPWNGWRSCRSTASAPPSTPPWASTSPSRTRNRRLRICWTGCVASSGTAASW